MTDQQPPEKVCGTCASITKMPNNAQQIGQENFQCRRFPPQTIIVGPGQGTVTYPSVIPTFPACGEHNLRVQANRSHLDGT